MDTVTDFTNYVNQNDVWEEKAAKLYEIQKLKAYYSKLATALSKELVDLSGGQNSAGKEYVFHYHLRVGSVDYTQVPELKFVDLDKYRKGEVLIWKLENVGQKVLEKIKD